MVGSKISWGKHTTHRTFPTVGGRSRFCIGARARAEGEVRAGFAKTNWGTETKIKQEESVKKVRPNFEKNLRNIRGVSVSAPFL